MAILRKPQTGQPFITAPKVRSSRMRYEKTPLVVGRTGLGSWLATLFRRRPRPFAASALADRIDRGLGVSRLVLDEKRPVSAASGTILNESISSQLREHAIAAYTRADNALDDLDDNLRQEAAWLDEARPDEILSTLDAKLEDKLITLHTHLLPLAQALVRARATLAEFQHRHGIPEDIEWGKRLDLAVIGQIGILLVFEFIANSLFQADTQQTGLIGGVFVATLTTLATIILGALFGIGMQRTHRGAPGGSWTGALLLVLAFVLTYIFVSSLSLIRIAGESGSLHPLEVARNQLMADPFAGIRAMLDLPAFAYTLCIVTLIVLVAKKYLAYGGAFPGGRKRMLDYLAAQEEFESQYEDEVADAKEIATDQSELLDHAPSFITSCKIPIQTLIADHENIIEQHSHDMEDILCAGRLFSAFIREHSPGAQAGTITLPATATANTMNEHRDKLRGRHDDFRAAADELCARDDVSQASLKLARERFNDVLEAKLGEYALEKEKMLDKALSDFKGDKNWKTELLAWSSSVAAKPASRPREAAL